jgi:uncharacterized protein (UPF0261 family)
MVNGRVNRIADAAELAADQALQQRLLGVGRHAHDETPAPRLPDDAGTAVVAQPTGPKKIYLSNPKLPTRWSQPVPVRLIEQSARTVSDAAAPLATAEIRPLAASAAAGIVLVAGTLDTKGPELRYLRDRLKALGLPVRLVDVSTSDAASAARAGGGAPSGADVPAHAIAAFHPRGASGVFTRDRGASVGAMALAFERWTARQPGIGGIIGAGGSGGSAILAPAMRTLPFGSPKLLISTVASGDVRAYVGASDMLMLHAVADVQGLNSFTRTVLDNGAFALAGMMQGRRTAKPDAGPEKPCVGITMFGVTTPAVQQLTAALGEDYECLVFHATGIGGQAMEKLIDLTTTEICDLLMGGVFPAGEDRFGAVIRQRIAYVGSCGALDMVNFGARETVPPHYRGRTLHQHNPQVTLMRTTPDENAAMGRWIGERLNRMEGQVRFFLPMGGVSALDAPGQPFHDPLADQALFDALETTVRQTPHRQLIRLPGHINDPQSVAALLGAFRQLQGGARPQRRQASR